MGYSDTDVAEYVFSARPSIDQLVKFLCKDLSKACSVKPPPVPTVIGCNSYFKIDRVRGEPFIAKSSKDAEMEKILKSMEGNILNDKDTPKQDYKQKLLQGISGTGTVIKEHINKVSKQIKNWWTGKTKGSSHPKAKKTDL
ncbi:hypothetical protein GW17_00001302 [Ensete ventricosum]|nr:hypothetical protein GW17_00001302 [Ensete ventricosum]